MGRGPEQPLEDPIDSGQITGVDVSGCSVLTVNRIPGNVLAGKWDVVMLIDDGATAEQRDRCLRVCRSPGGYLRQHYRRGVAAAFRLGAGHGMFCVGCCWALMLVAFATGVASLWWMAALTAVMVVEKTSRGGRRGIRPIGVGLIILGLLMLAPVAGSLGWA